MLKWPPPYFCTYHVEGSQATRFSFCHAAPGTTVGTETEKSNSNWKAFKIWKSQYRSFAFYLAWLFHPESSEKFWLHWPISIATFTLHLTVSLFTTGNQIDLCFPFSPDSSRLSTLLNKTRNSIAWHKGKGIHIEHPPTLNFSSIQMVAFFLLF